MAPHRRDRAPGAVGAALRIRAYILALRILDEIRSRYPWINGSLEREVGT
jgi:hypothetical protein